jgi:hypothetical protein
MAAMADDGAHNQLVKFGGEDSLGHAIDATWVWNGMNWNEAATGAGHTPPARFGASMAYDSKNDELVLFGGQAGNLQFNDAWVWDPTAMDWNLLIANNPSNPNQPSPRSQASFAFDSETNQLVLFGGESAPTSSLLGDTWVLDDSTTSPGWTLEHPTHSPSERSAAAFAFDPSSANLVLFGGLTDVHSGGDNAETWFWTGTDWAQQHPSTSPPPLEGASMALAPNVGPSGGEDILFGGNSDGISSGQTWAWSTGDWSLVHTAHSPPARGYASMDFDTNLRNLVLTGGAGTGLFTATSTALTDTWEFGPATTPTATTITSSVNPSVVNQSVTFTATVSPTPDSGQVVFDNNGTPIAGCASVTLTGATAACTTSFAAAGTFPITAQYVGDAHFGGSVSAPLNQVVNSTSKRAATGYWMDASDGGIFSFGTAGFYGSVPGALKPGQTLDKPVVGMSSTGDGHGYWMVASDGGLFAFGDAAFHGSVPGALGPGRQLNKPVVGMATTPDGGGYWMVATDGGVFAFGDAGYFGSMGGRPLNQPIEGMASTPDGGGYWMVAADGGIFSFGDAQFFGSIPQVLQPGQVLNKPVVGMAANPASGAGYWMDASDGGIFAFGSAPFLGSMGGVTLNRPMVGMAADFTGLGYWLVAGDGGVFSFGDSQFFGSVPGVLQPGQQLNAPVVGLAPSFLTS